MPYRYPWKIFGIVQGKYALILVIFLMFGFYNFAIVPAKSTDKSKTSSEKSEQEITWDVTSEAPEKTYEGIFQGRSGDWYRLGIEAQASGESRLRVSLRSLFNEPLPIGTFEIAKSDSPQYQELVFPVPSGGMFSDISFQLVTDEKKEAWPFVGVAFGKPVLSRLNVKSRAEAERLIPTLIGTSERVSRTFTAEALQSSKNVIFETRFTAEADFIESVRLNLRGQKAADGYTAELYRVGDGKESQALMSVYKRTLNPDDIAKEKDEWGNQAIVFPVRLTRGVEYLLTLKEKESTKAWSGIVMQPLAGREADLGEGEGKSVLAILFGKQREAAGGTLVSGARIEDFGGGEMLYSYALSGEKEDYFNLFATEGQVTYDPKKKRVGGAQKQRTSFTYRFFTVYPFERLLLSAKQAGNDEKEVKLEYSLDSAFWQEVPFTQLEKESQLFSLLLSGTGAERTVYVRITYNGEDKKSGVFGLDRLVVRAQLKRP